MTIRKKYIGLFVLSILILSAVFFLSQSDAILYHQTIARVTRVDVTKQTVVKDWHGNRDKEVEQALSATLLNGKHKGENVRLTNEYTASQAYSQKYNKRMEIFIRLGTKTSGTWSGTITGVKRDTVIVSVLTVFLLLLVTIGKKQGYLSVLSLLLNVACLSFALDFYIAHRNTSLLAIFLIVVLVCTVFSLFLVSGYRKKTFIAILSTLITTYLALALACFVMYVTSGNGIHYDSMEFVTIPPEKVFLSEILIGSLGAIMDIAITITSSMDELYENNPGISQKRLRQSGFDIGRDVMGIMTNILLFAYISGTIPMIVICLKNGYPITYAFSLNLSLELIRFLVGGIGIVLAIPITIYLSSSILFRERGRAK